MFEQYRYRPEPFQDALSRFIDVRTYSRYLPEQNRRETWFETVRRYCEYLFSVAGDALDDATKHRIFLAVYDLKVLGSMRLLWSAGEAARQNNVTAYNCSFSAVNDPVVFDEALFILMCGTGFGGSVEYEYIEQLPRILKPKQSIPDTHIVDDSREGWALALRQGIDRWYHGHDITYDFSGLRPAGARLRTMGGRSSGPEPLKRLIAFTRDKFRERAGRRLQTIDCADILMMTGESVEMGGVRRSSEILLFSPDDPLMLEAKQGAYYNQYPHRKMANLSMAFDERPRDAQLLHQWLALAKSGSGEPGIFIKSNARTTAPRRNRWGVFGTNPCGEIVLRGDHPLGGGQFCNLSEAIARPDDDYDTLRDKVEIAAILGTVQSTLTDFPYLRPGWKANCEEERLLGSSITGIADCPQLFDAELLGKLRDHAIAVNVDYAQRMGVNPSTAITCVKPSGTASQLVGSSSGLHARWSKYYIRRIRISVTDPLLAFLRTLGVPCEPEVGQDPTTATTWVLSFPVKSPDGAVTRDKVSVTEQLERWLTFKKHWCEHNPSCTIYVKDHEWIKTLAWIESHWNEVGGLSFLPSNDHVYRLAPYEEITEERYLELMTTFPKDIDYSLLSAFENDDNTSGGGSGCEGVTCEIASV